MTKVAALTRSVSRNAGGLFESVRRLVQLLVGTGTDVRVFGIQDAHVGEDMLAWKPVNVSVFPPIGPKSFGYSPRFLRELGAYAPDLVHTHGNWCYSSVATNRYGRKMRVPYVVSPHGMLDSWAIRNSQWKKAIAYFLYERAHLCEAHCLIALCESEARAIRQVGLKNPIAIIPNGVDFPETRNVGCGVQKPPWQRVTKPGSKVLLYLGRIHPKKGLVNLLRAWATIQSNHKADWVLALAGWDQDGHERKLKQLATELGLTWADLRSPISDRQSPVSVAFLGPQFHEPKAACFRDCNAFVLPSLSEGLPMVVLEAWANAKPVLKTPECNLPEGFVQGAALRIETKAESISRGLEQLFEMTDSERAIIGQKGYTLAAQRFTWPRIAEEMERVYNWILGGGKKPDCIVDF